MRVGKFKAYRGAIGTIEVTTDKKIYGKLLNTKDLVNYYADSVEQLEVEFHKSVDEYLEMRQALFKVV